MSAILNKEEKEKQIFSELALLAGLIVVPGSIYQNPPPAPDVECEIEGLGQRAYELTALDAPATRTRLSHMFSTRPSWNRALLKLSRSDYDQLCNDCKSAHLTIDFTNAARPQERTKTMEAIQKLLLTAPGYEGPIHPAAIGNALGYLKGHVHRGHVHNGPTFSSASGGHWLRPQLDKVTQKLTISHYETDAPLELFAYAEHDDPDGHVDSRREFEQCVLQHLPNSKFSRVHLFYLGHRKYCYSFP